MSGISPAFCDTKIPEAPQAPRPNCGWPVFWQPDSENNRAWRDLEIAVWNFERGLPKKSKEELREIRMNPQGGAEFDAFVADYIDCKTGVDPQWWKETPRWILQMAYTCLSHSNDSHPFFSRIAPWASLWMVNSAVESYVRNPKAYTLKSGSSTKVGEVQVLKNESGVTLNNILALRALLGKDGNSPVMRISYDATFMEERFFLKEYFCLSDREWRDFQSRMKGVEELGERHFHLIITGVEPEKDSPIIQAIRSILRVFRPFQLGQLGFFSTDTSVVIVPSFSMLQIFSDVIADQNSRGGRLRIIPQAGQYSGEDVEKLGMMNETALGVFLPSLSLAKEEQGRNGEFMEVTDGYWGTHYYGFTIHDLYHLVRRLAQSKNFLTQCNYLGSRIKGLGKELSSTFEAVSYEKNWEQLVDGELHGDIWLPNLIIKQKVVCCVSKTILKSMQRFNPSGFNVILNEILESDELKKELAWKDCSDTEKLVEVINFIRFGAEALNLDLR